MEGLVWQLALTDANRFTGGAAHSPPSVSVQPRPPFLLRHIFGVRSNHLNPKVEQVCLAAGIEPTRNEKGKFCCPGCGVHGVSINKSTGRAKCYAHGG
jgi:hypothetical protein